MTDRVGQHLGNYELIQYLGQGTFAAVYLGHHIHLDTQAAIKVLHTQLASDGVEKFRDEARMLAHLVHPHIIRVLDFGVEGSTPFLVMDYATNGTVRQHCPKGTQMPLTTVVLFVQQIASALQYAHDEKVIHRDVKPENVLVGKHHEVLLSDFGIAVLSQSWRTQSQSLQNLAGTPCYMAPEQILFVTDMKSVFDCSNLISFTGRSWGMFSEEQKVCQKCQKDSFSVKSHPCANIIDILPAIRPYVSYLSAPAMLGRSICA